MTSLMTRLDSATRGFWQTLGRPVDLVGTEEWLAASTHHLRTVGDGWLSAAAAAIGGSVRIEERDSGLLPDLARLDGPCFTASDLRPEARDFYEHTSRWRMETWAQ